MNGQRIETGLSRFLLSERKDHGLVLDAIARDLTVLLHSPKPISRGTVSSWETGARLPSPRSLEAIGRVFGWDEETRQRVAMLYQEASVERSKSKAA